MSDQDIYNEVEAVRTTVTENNANIEQTTMQGSGQDIYKEVEAARNGGIMSIVALGANAIQGYIVIPDSP
jgi:hypothetical protein